MSSFFEKSFLKQPKTAQRSPRTIRQRRMVWGLNPEVKI